MDKNECPEQRRLHDAVAKAIRERYLIKQQQDAVRDAGEYQIQLVARLAEMRTDELKASRALRVHMQAHRCNTWEN